LKKRYPQIQFYSSEQFWTLKRFWKFGSWLDNPRLYRDMKLLITSGVYYKLLNYFETQKYFSRRNKISLNDTATRYNSLTEPTLQLTGRIVTLFVLFVSILLMTLVILIAESSICCIKRAALRSKVKVQLFVTRVLRYRYQLHVNRLKLMKKRNFK